MGKPEEIQRSLRGERSIPVTHPYGGEQADIQVNLPPIELVDGTSPFGPPLAWKQLESGLMASEDWQRAERSYWSPDLSPTKDAVRERFGIDERSYVVFNSGTGVDGLLRTSLILIPKNPKSPPKAAAVGPHYPGRLKQLHIIGGLLPFPYSPDINLSADEALERVIEQHERNPVKLANIYFSRVDFKGDIASRKTSLKLVRHFTAAGVTVDADEVGLDVADESESLARETMVNSRLRVYRDASKTLGVPGLGLGIVIMHRSKGPNFESAMGDRYIRGPNGLIIKAFWDNDLILPHLKEVRPKIAQAKKALTDEAQGHGLNVLPTDPRTPMLVIGGELGLAGVAAELGLKLASGGGFDKTSEPPLSTEHVRLVISKDDATNIEVARRLSLAERIAVGRKTPNRTSYGMPTPDLLDDVPESTD